MPLRGLRRIGRTLPCAPGAHGKGAIEHD
jgi:hypothetical protein